MFIQGPLASRLTLDYYRVLYSVLCVILFQFFLQTAMEVEHAGDFCCRTPRETGFLKESIIFEIDSF